MTDAPDYAVLARRFSTIQSAMIHQEDSQLRGDDFYAEALRRLLSHAGSGFIPVSEHEHVLSMNRGVDRANGKQAQRTLAELTRQYEENMRHSAKRYAAAIRARCNERTVPSKLRREGIETAAAWLEGKD